ncbi:hypothetical protein OPV22_017353 [Ensete ventricosum]|uniref:Uncharacterized protein n=1 Tax=Ensete ventricosum TaxID=4639 RepID=A0AAV8QW59_ENSVE|nr:hypothetical protein OPV22_017353 [Ensete ventricosum]
MRVVMACRMHTLSHGFRTIPDNHLPRLQSRSSYGRKGNVSSLPNSEPPNSPMHDKLHVKVCAVRRRRAYIQSSDTYVLLEPGKGEEFVTEEQLRLRLKGWLEKWPADAALPPDLARFNTVDDAVSHLVSTIIHTIYRQQKKEDLPSPHK